MGRVYTFTCPRCEYRAHVSGGVEEGFHCVTQTIVCRNCKTLHDVATRTRVVEEAAATPSLKKILPTPKDHLPPMLLFGKPPRTQWLVFKRRCPVAAFHVVEEWTAPGKCPRCNAFMEREVLPYRVWD